MQTRVVKAGKKSKAVKEADVSDPILPQVILIHPSKSKGKLPWFGNMVLVTLVVLGGLIIWRSSGHRKPK